MTKPLILITGASGKTGGAVADELLTQGFPVRALVRRLDARSEALAARGAQIVVGDLFDARQVADAMRGVQRAYFVPPFAANMIDSARIFADAAVAARLEAVAVMSQWLASLEHPSILTRMHAEADGLFAALPDIVHVTIAPGYFADNYLRLIDFASQLGLLPNLTGDSRNAPPATEDIARVAAAVLADPGRHAGRRYRPTGPALLSVPEMAPILSRVLGRRVRALPMPFWLFLKAARMQGVAEFDLDGMSYYVRDHRDGAFEFGAPNDDVLRVTGRPAESFETTARRYAALPKAQRSFGSQARAWLDFMLTPMRPGHDLAAYEHRMGFPRLEQPLFAMQNPSWRIARGGTHNVSVIAA
ncbi:conserved hypothetical protein; putative transcriptional regulator (NmrA-like) [Bradyrhizobium sp. ORS 278]|uniref:NmrA family NAD(P)-binding protein n=1 Tax=Bradyrhizobium sp. (strain ORS 278) TaxID=114615 RepID=UPI0001508E86|nr:NmrA family NAD(P)-binding protein [Bradyrhizobium sp. ORS 278]CAL78374.1 conserved hypothetical protein; putative transcriptional regulator (NmrA-like) [Bradyrhizobium sp. ORS 278]